jgi:hypothetical protein
MARITDRAVTPEIVEAIMESPDRRARANAIADQLLREIEWSITYGRDPSPLAKVVMPAILRWMETREQSDREDEAAERYQAMREFVQSFRKGPSRNGD